MVLPSMKVRSSFVSNSSSSSFIIAKTEIFKHFKIDKSVLKEAIDDLFMPDKNVNYFIYEMPNERAQAMRKFGNLLQQWNQCLIGDNDIWSPEKENIEAFDKLLWCLRKIDPSWYFLTGDDEDLEYSKSPDYVKAIVSTARKNLRIRKADEVLLDDSTQFFIHFSENDIQLIHGIDEDGKKDIDGNLSMNNEAKYDTYAYSSDRFIEVLFNWLVDHKKIDPKDPEMLKLYPLSDYAKQSCSDKVSYLNNDIYTYKDFIDEGVSHAIMHEG